MWNSWSKLFDKTYFSSVLNQIPHLYSRCHRCYERSIVSVLGFAERCSSISSFRHPSCWRFPFARTFPVLEGRNRSFEMIAGTVRDTQCSIDWETNSAEGETKVLDDEHFVEWFKKWFLKSIRQEKAQIYSEDLRNIILTLKNSDKRRFKVWSKDWRSKTRTRRRRRRRRRWKTSNDVIRLFEDTMRVNWNSPSFILAPLWCIYCTFTINPTDLAMQLFFDAVRRIGGKNDISPLGSPSGLSWRRFCSSLDKSIN